MDSSLTRDMDIKKTPPRRLSDAAVVE